jgi:hypothetical protein
VRSLLRLAGLAALLLLASCAQRTYVVFPPDRETPMPSNRCILDFSEIELRSSTVARLKKWKEDTIRAQSDCRGLQLKFHQPGERLKGDGFEAPDNYLVVGIGLDSRPERPPLTYPPIIRAIVEPRPHVVVVDPTPFVCPDDLRCVPPDQVCTRPRCPIVVRVVGRLVVPPPQLAFEIPEPPAKTDDPIAGTPKTGDQPDNTDDPDEDDPEQDGKKARQPDGPAGIEQALPPALIGGGLVYALALLKMLPFAGGAGAAPFRPGPPRPSSGGQDVQEPGPAGPAGNGDSRPRDPRVRLGKAGFAEEPR